MKKQKKQLILMLLVLVLLVVSYVALKKNNAVQETAIDETTEGLFDKNIDSSQVTELSYYYGEELCSFVKEDDTWKAREDKNLTLKQSAINTMVSSLVATNIVSRLEEVIDLSEYGLSEPVNTITVLVEGTEHVVKVGNLNELTSYLYVQMDDSNTVYVVSSGITNSFNYGMDNLVEVEE